MKDTLLSITNGCERRNTTSPSAPEKRSRERSIATTQNAEGHTYQRAKGKFAGTLTADSVFSQLIISLLDHLTDAYLTLLLRATFWLNRTVGLGVIVFARGIKLLIKSI